MAARHHLRSLMIRNPGLLILVTILVSSGVARSQSWIDQSTDCWGALTTNLPLIATSSDSTWELLKITSDATSGAATITGTAKLSGSYAVIAQIGTPPVKMSGFYSWTQNSWLAGNGSLANEEPEYDEWLSSSIFAAQAIQGRLSGCSRYVICQLHQDETRHKRFGDVHLVPDAWSKSVVPAIDFFKSNPQFQANMSLSNDIQSQCESILHVSNPYMVLGAFQILVSSNRLTQIDMDTVLTSGDVRLIAACSALGYLYQWSDNDSNGQWFLDRVHTIKSMDQLEGVTIGTWEAHSPNFTGGSTADLPIRTRIRPTEDYDYDIKAFFAIRANLNANFPNSSKSDPRWLAIDTLCNAALVGK